MPGAAGCDGRSRCIDHLFSGRYLIGIVSHQINLFLLHRCIEPLGQRIVGGRLTRAKDNSAPKESKNSCVIAEVFGDPRSTRSSGFVPL